MKHIIVFIALLLTSQAFADEKTKQSADPIGLGDTLCTYPDSVNDPNCKPLYREYVLVVISPLSIEMQSFYSKKACEEAIEFIKLYTNRSVGNSNFGMIINIEVNKNLATECVRK